MDSKTSRYQSRILREMHQNRENPFNSPPSSTGSHGTVTLTSDISLGPEGESTRRAQEDSIQLPRLPSMRAKRTSQATPFRVNTSAIGKDFPGWSPSRDATEDIYNVTGDYAKQEKENIPPSSSTVASPTDAKSYHVKTGSNPRRGNVTTLIQTLKAAQAVKESTPRPPSSRAATPQQKSSAGRRQTNFSQRLDPVTPNQISRSFYLPNLTHIDDFVSGVLKLSSTKTGMPVFVKHGKVHDRESRSSPGYHVGVDAIDVPEDEQQIFVSLDKIRDEICTLKAHDDEISRKAEQFQEEIFELQIQLSKVKSRKDSAMGSDSESSLLENLNAQKSQLEERVASLQAQLDKANRKISIDEIHTESYINERDEALKTASTQLEKIRHLQSELSAANSGFDNSGNDDVLRSENRSLRDDNSSLRQKYKVLLEENQSLRGRTTAATQQDSTLQLDIKRLQKLLETAERERDDFEKQCKDLKEEKRTLQQEYLGLERQNEKLYNDTKSLQQKVTMLESRVKSLKDNNDELHDMLNVANAETGTVTLDVKELKDRFEKKNRDLSDANARLQRQMIELKSDFASKRFEYEEEIQRLGTRNDRLNEQINQLSTQFEQMLRESRQVALNHEEKTTSLTQRLQEVRNREAMLVSQLRETAEKQSNLQHQIHQRTKAVEEAIEITREVRDFSHAAGKSKPVKVTRIIEPAGAKSRSTAQREVSGRTTTQTDLQVEDDYTQQIDLTQDSDFVDTFANNDMAKLQEALQRARGDGQEADETDEDVDEAEVGVTDDMSLPPFFSQARRTESPSTKTKSVSEQSKGLPSGILKNTRRGTERDITGRFSVKSGISGVSMPSPTRQPEGRHERRHSDSARFDLEVEDNMTSALFMDDITLESRKRAEKRKVKLAVPSLSTDAKRVLDGLCSDHDCRNCVVCVRINSHVHEDTIKVSAGKKMVRVDKPVPVTDRIPNPTEAVDSDYEDQPTMRPAKDPGVALATVLKNLKDELIHLELQLTKAQEQYHQLDGSYGRRQQKRLSAEISRLMRALDMKKSQIYDLHDVLEGQKESGQQMNTEAVEVTLMSILSKDDTWNGIVG